jgi:N6-L-threonylcarbamoyladenine synthase
VHIAVGVDTSCYTTSVAAFDEKGNLMADERIPLVVAKGGRGLAQSEMVFQHVNNLPKLFVRMREQIGTEAAVDSISATSRPRPLEESYMPVFRAGLSIAESVAAGVGCECLQFSHQENHILAGLWSAGGPVADRFLAVHMSGGTTEIVAAEKTADGFDVRIIGGSRDLHAGQLIDRLGVKMGLPFPAGPHMEDLSTGIAVDKKQVPVSVETAWISFSGPETHLCRQVEAGMPTRQVAAMTQYCIAESVAKALSFCVSEEKMEDILLVGGVAANCFIKEHIQSSVGTKHPVRFWFPQPKYSGDNAVGAAYFALRKGRVR